MHNLLVSFFPLDSVIVTTLLSFPNKSWSFSTQFSHLSKATSGKTNPGGSLWGIHFFPTKRPYGLVPDTHGCMVRRKCSLVFVRPITVTMPVFLQCVWLWFENGTATGKTEGSEILLFFSGTPALFMTPNYGEVLGESTEQISGEE